MQANGVVEELCGIWIQKFFISPKNTALMNGWEVKCLKMYIFCTITQSIVGVV